mmetsp:Transcript_24810/g.62917  ORF Transcript_24810/g.62917 Transcript_24810/m.62917 type:complete len:220 (-) Transcript_24810:537-1196(-)
MPTLHLAAELERRPHRLLAVLVQPLVLRVDEDSALGMCKEHDPCEAELRVARAVAVRLGKVMILDGVVVADKKHAVLAVWHGGGLPKDLLVQRVAEVEAELEICSVCPAQEGRVLLRVRAKHFEVNVCILADLPNVVDIGTEGARANVLGRVKAESCHPCLKKHVDVLLMTQEHLFGWLQVTPLSRPPALKTVLVVPIVAHHVLPGMEVVASQSRKVGV